MVFAYFCDFDVPICHCNPGQKRKKKVYLFKVVSFLFSIFFPILSSHFCFVMKWKAYSVYSLIFLDIFWGSLAFTKCVGAQWQFLNKVSAISHLMSFKVSQEDKNQKIASDSHMSSGFMSISTADAFDASQKRSMAEIQVWYYYYNYFIIIIIIIIIIRVFWALHGNEVRMLYFHK